LIVPLAAVLHKSQISGNEMKKLFFTVLPFIFAATGVLAQRQNLDTLVKKFQDYRVNGLQEKIYAHLDRSFYLTGETLWFKVYTVDGTFHRPINVSKVAYVEILDKANLPVLQAKIALDDGHGNGSLFLPASLNSGNYTFRLYTNWMKNFSPEFYFHQNFTIVNPFVKLETNETAKTSNYTADFFPEGGNLVTGIRSKVAFKISDASGKGVFCKGYLLNQSNDTLASFHPEKFGIGHFSFTPSANNTYKVILREGPGKTSVHGFPEQHPSGYVMHLVDSGKFIRMEVTARSPASPYIYLFVHARHIIAKAELLKLENDRGEFIFNKGDLPEGVSHITLFNEQLDPLCERLYFSMPKKLLDINIKTSAEYTYRRRVALSVETKDKSGKAKPAHVSVSVFRTDSLSFNNQVDIFHHLWLNADLAGVIESPEYYFNSSDPAVSLAMDNLMLTHGWRKFEWKQLLTGQKSYDYLPEHNGHIINGVVSNDQGVQGRILTYLASPGRIVRAYGSRSNVRGEVRFDIKDFYGSRKLIIQTMTDSTQNFQVSIKNPFSSAFSHRTVPELKMTSSAESALVARSIAMQVQDVYYYEKYGNRFVSPSIDSSAFYGHADNTYLLDDYTRFQIMEEVMREYVPGVLVRKRKDGFHFIMVDIVNGGILKGDPMILLDGVPLFDADEIMRVDPLRVKKLEVVKRQYYLGHAVFSGILSYSTYDGDLRGLELNPRSISLNYDGLQVKRIFYSPRYNNEQDRANRMPDQRYLLHWEPDVVTDRSGKAELEFFTSDLPGRYLVVVQGLSDDGFCAGKSYSFRVNPPDNQ
jgi:hypothetical protein